MSVESVEQRLWLRDVVLAMDAGSPLTTQMHANVMRILVQAKLEGGKDRIRLAEQILHRAKVWPTYLKRLEDA